MDKFIAIKDVAYNTKYIKEIYCNEKSCKMTIANTQNGYTGESALYGNSKWFEDKVVICEKEKDEKGYKNLFSFSRQA